MTSAKRLFVGKNITCLRGGRLLFEDLSFGLNPGDILHLTGPNGSGKSSLLRIMSGVLPIVEGALFWDGECFLENGEAAHAARLSFLPATDKSLKNFETVFENLQFWASIWGAQDKDCREVLEKMDLLKLKDRQVRYLSAGQKRRVSLSRIFLKQAPLWVLDEPFNGLDQASSNLLMSEVDAHCSRGGMVVLASHYMMKSVKNGALRHIEVGVQ